MKRDAQSFYDDFSIYPPQHVWHPPQGHWPGFGEQAKANRLLPNSTNWLFPKSPKSSRASGAWRHPHSLAPFPIWAIVTSLSDTSTLPARVNTCVNVASK